MRKFAIIIPAMLAMYAGPSQAAEWDGKYVSQIQIDSRPCAFFSLTGVTQSDPVVSGSWFAIPKAAPNYQEQISILMSAKLSHSPVKIVTNGTISCEWANVTTIILQ